MDLFEVFRGGEADFRGPGHDPQLFSILTDTLRGICVQPSFDQSDSVRLCFAEAEMLSTSGRKPSTLIVLSYALTFFTASVL